MHEEYENVLSKDTGRALISQGSLKMIFGFTEAEKAAEYSYGTDIGYIIICCCEIQYLQRI